MIVRAPIKQCTLVFLILRACDGENPGEPILTKSIMDMSYTAGVLSSLAYNNCETEKIDACPEVGPGHKFVSYKDYNDGVNDSVIVAETSDGLCFGIFRGTELTVSDWSQNFDPRTEEVCNDEGNCCKSRQGFADAYDADYKDDFEKDLRACAAKCTDKNKCVVLGGHSQGGAVATLASIMFDDLDPFVFTFGQPSAIFAPCKFIDAKKSYRYINSVMDEDELEHDVVPFSPSLGAGDFGYMIVISYEHYAVASFGLNAEPLASKFHMNVSPFLAHTMDDGIIGYVNRIKAIIDFNQYPVETDGWSKGDFCSNGGECESGHCIDGVCSAPLGSCEECTKDSDCHSGSCISGACSGLDGFVDNGCPCNWSEDCLEGRCEGVFSAICYAKLPGGEGCQEDSDCISENCNWWFKCTSEQGRLSSPSNSMRVSMLGETNDGFGTVESGQQDVVILSNEDENDSLYGVFMLATLFTVLGFATRNILRSPYEVIPTSELSSFL